MLLKVIIIINSGDNIDINYTDLVGNNKIAGIMVNGKTVYNESFLIENILCEIIGVILFLKRILLCSVRFM